MSISFYSLSPERIDNSDICFFLTFSSSPSFSLSMIIFITSLHSYYMIITQRRTAVRLYIDIKSYLTRYFNVILGTSRLSCVWVRCMSDKVVFTVHVRFLTTSLSQSLHVCASSWINCGISWSFFLTIAIVGNRFIWWSFSISFVARMKCCCWTVH